MKKALSRTADLVVLAAALYRELAHSALSLLPRQRERWD